MSFQMYKPKLETIIGYLGALILFTYFTMILMGMLQVKEWRELHTPMLLTVIICTYIIVVDKRTLPLGANTMVYIYTVLSLLGLTILLPFFPGIINIRSEVTMNFLTYKELTDAIALSCMGILLFILSTSIFSHQVNGEVEVLSPIGQGLKDLDESDSSKYKGITFLGLFLTAYCALFFVYLAVTNPGMLTSGYTDRMLVTNNSSIYSHTTVIMALSIVIVFTKGSRKEVKIGSMMFAVSVIINFAMGNRGEVYYPILACIAAYTRRKGTLKIRTLLIGIGGSLLLIPLIRTLRTVGAFSGGSEGVLQSISPVEGIAEAIGEMGFQIGPFTYLLRYLNEGGSFQHGSTLVYSFQMFLCKYIPFMSAPDPTSPAAIKTVMPTTYYAFSSLAEGYFNFGIIGMLLFVVFLAWYLVNQNKYLQSIYSTLFSNMFLVEIILWVRNSSATMPVYFAWTIVLLGLSWIVQQFYEEKSKVVKQNIISR